jgi:hypothetical protein
MPDASTLKSTDMEMNRLIETLDPHCLAPEEIAQVEGGV